MKRIIMVFLILCLVMPNICYAEEEKPDAFEFLLALALVGAGTYCIIEAIPKSKDEDFNYGYGILGALALYMGTQGLIEFSIKMARAKRGISRNDSVFLMASMRF